MGKLYLLGNIHAREYRDLAEPAFQSGLAPADRWREAIIAPPQHFIASADYSQIELRITAHLSGDEALLRAFREGLDVHRATASEVFGRYFERYPGVKRYMAETRLSAKSKGYVETVFGRRLYLPEINSPNGPRRGGAERAAINAPMQGTAADLIKLSMVKIQDVLDAHRRRTKMIMQVHDELVFEVPEDEVDWVRSEIPGLMAGVADLRVPLLAEIGVAENWDKAH